MARGGLPAPQRGGELIPGAPPSIRIAAPLAALLISLGAGAGESHPPTREIAADLEPILLLEPGLSIRVEDSATGSDRSFGGSLRRAEVGFALSSRILAAEISLDVARGVPELRDAFLELGAAAGPFALRGGFLRPPLGREYLAARDRRGLPFAPSSYAVIDPQRELGAEARGRLFKLLGYSIGVWPGAAEGADGAPRRGELIALAGGRLSIEPLGPLPERDGSADIAGGGPRVALAAACLFGRRRAVPFPSSAEPGAAYAEDRFRLGAEAALQWAGFSAVAEVVWSTAAPAEGTEGSLAARLPRVHGLGGALRLGAFAVPRRLEFALRLDVWDEDVEVGGELVSPEAGVTFFAVDTRVALQAGYRARFAVEDPFPAGSPARAPVTHEIIASLVLVL